MGTGRRVPINISQSVPAAGDDATLTRYEWLGLKNVHNLADGHARQAQSPGEDRVVDQIASLYREVEGQDQVALQRSFEELFYRQAGQPSVLRRANAPLHHYSSSVSTEVVANVLRDRGLSVGLLHPTFDNIAAILRRHRVPLTPVTEDIFSTPEDDRHYEGHDALFLVTPNNPTGLDPTPDVLRTVADQCQARGMLLILDVCFRFFSRHLATWDHYAYFEEIGVSHIGIEDTGKTWPTLDLKVGSLVADDGIYPELERITDDVLLNVSPFIFGLLANYIAADRGLNCLAVAERNRQQLRAALDDSPVELVCPEAPMSVAWLRLPDRWEGSKVCAWLADQGISVLPGGPFFWDDNTLGETNLRVALMRPEDEFTAGAVALGTALKQYGPATDDPRPGDGEDAGGLVVRVAGEVLERPVELDDDFFAAGGNSLAAMHLIGRLREETRLPLRVKVLFEHPLLGDLAARIADERQVAAGAAFGGSEPDPKSSLRAAFASERSQ
jgi:aspartate/methionine/tyrosine aminotransferase